MRCVNNKKKDYGNSWIIGAPMAQTDFEGGRRQCKPLYFSQREGASGKEYTKLCEMTLNYIFFSASEGEHPPQTPPVTLSPQVPKSCLSLIWAPPRNPGSTSDQYSAAPELHLTVKETSIIV